MGKRKSAHADRVSKGGANFTIDRDGDLVRMTIDFNDGTTVFRFLPARASWLAQNLSAAVKALNNDDLGLDRPVNTDGIRG